VATFGVESLSIKGTGIKTIDGDGYFGRTVPPISVEMVPLLKTLQKNLFSLKICFSHKLPFFLESFPQTGKSLRTRKISNFEKHLLYLVIIKDDLTGVLSSEYPITIKHNKTLV
jgi:hypothetical protein